MPENPPTVHAAGQLRRHVSGAMLTRDDPGYDQARRGWGLAVDQHPALVVIPDDTSDVATAVRVARDTGLGVAVQSTGHGVLYPGDDSLLVVTSRLTSVHVDPAARTARVGAGATWQAVLDAATPHGWHPCSGRRRMSGWSATCSAAASGGWGGSTGSAATACAASRS